MPAEQELPRPEIKRRISTLEILQGQIVSATERVSLMSSDEYEKFILEWVFGVLTPKYQRIRSFAGAGDKGRDIVGYYPDRSIDIYQCKHYDSKIAPTTLYVELGKICYYTYTEQYPIPKKYYIVAPQGCGPTLLDMIAKPETINQKLITHWDTHCKKGITKTTDVELNGEFKSYVENFDFSIVTDISPIELIEQHKTTQFHVLRFGGGIKKYRELIPVPDPNIQPREQIYTTSLFEVYAQETGAVITNIVELQNNNTNHFEHFIMQRNSFYCVESLEKFSRDNFPDADPLPFQELKDDAYQVLYPTLKLRENDPGFTRVLLAAQTINAQSFANNPLSQEMRPLDKNGLCHHLINDERIKWIV